jgi:hypothetical protein
MLFTHTNKQAAEASQQIAPGQVCFLLDITRGLLFGIFVTATGVTDKIDPTLFSENAKVRNAVITTAVHVEH